MGGSDCRLKGNYRHYSSVGSIRDRNPPLPTEFAFYLRPGYDEKLLRLGTRPKQIKTCL